MMKMSNQKLYKLDEVTKNNIQQSQLEMAVMAVNCNDVRQYNQCIQRVADVWNKTVSEVNFEIVKELYKLINEVKCNG